MPRIPYQKSARFNTTDIEAELERQMLAEQATCTHQNTGIENIGYGDSAKKMTVCKDCFKVISVE
jgi:hypothetical protein